MKRTFAMLCILAATFAGNAQDKNFDLSKYKFPDYKRHELEFNLNSHGTSEKHFLKIPESSNLNITHLESSNSSFNNQLNLGYTYENYARKRIDYFYSSLIGRYDHSKSSYQGNQYKDVTPYVDLSFNGFRRYYLTEDKVFLEGMTDCLLNYTSRKSKYGTGDTITDITKNGQLNVSAGMGIGIGRIEKVSDLWLAYYILEKLKAQKSLSRELQEKDVFEFARLASLLKNKRFFDARLRKIAELQSLDSLLKNQGLVHESDIAYFTTLNDYWSYGNFGNRKSGKELKFQLSPEYNIQYYKTRTETPNSPSLLNLVSKLQFDCSKQFNLFWDRKVHIDVVNSTLLAKDADVPDDYPGNLIGTNASLGFGFYPDSRTQLLLSANYHGSEEATYTNSNTSKAWFNEFSLNMEANYYISPQFQITANLNGNCWFSEYNSSKGHDIFYNLGIRYAIF
jgi:hypothetical protein